MTDPVEALVLDLLEWLSRGPRLASEVLEVWRTSCPRLPVWEEANARGYVERFHCAGEEAQVKLSAAGLAYVQSRRSAAGNRSPLRNAADQRVQALRR